MKSVPRLIRWLLQVAVAGTAAWPLLAAPAPGAEARTTITPAQIAAALGVNGIEVDVARITLPMRITSASPAPQLEVGPLVRVGEHNARVRVACHDHADCMPFYVSVPWQGEPPQAPTALSTAHEAALAPTRTNPPKSASMVRAGAHAVLAIDDHHLHIRVQVVCLEAGQPGRTIRVASLDHKQVYQAEIIDAGLVKGSL